MGRIFTVCLPDIGEGVVEGEVVEWLKDVGASLAQDEPVVVIMTDKATVELPAPRRGILKKKYFEEKEIALLDKPLYDIEIEGEEPKEKKEKGKLPEKEFKLKAPKKMQKPKGPADGRVLAKPTVRGVAKELGIDLQTVSGTGKDGLVTLKDLKMHGGYAPKLTRLSDDAIQQFSGIQASMAKKMAESKRLIPHFSYFEKVDASRLIQLRENFKKQGEKEGLHVTFMPFFIRALSLTISKHPLINSSYDASTKECLIHRQQNIGIAMQKEQGLIVLPLKGVQEMTLQTIVREYELLVQKVQKGKLSPLDMKDSTITLSNFGAFEGHGLFATPIINLPEVAILAVNQIQKQPYIKNDKVVICPLLNVSWSFDHQVIDGSYASQVSNTFCRFIQYPAKLLDDKP